jgi:hypothetical protein
MSMEDWLFISKAILSKIHWSCKSFSLSTRCGRGMGQGMGQKLAWQQADAAQINCLKEI